MLTKERLPIEGEVRLRSHGERELSRTVTARIRKGKAEKVQAKRASVGARGAP
jgi:hypothetical protein